jgi:hypothetical protein
MSHTYRQFTAWCKGREITPNHALLLAREFKREQQLADMWKNISRSRSPDPESYGIAAEFVGFSRSAGLALVRTVYNGNIYILDANDSERLAGVQQGTAVIIRKNVDGEFVFALQEILSLRENVQP